MSAKKGTTKMKKKVEESAFDSPVTVEEPKKASFNSKKLVFIIGAILTLCLIVGISLYYYLQYQKSQQLLNNPLLAAEREQQTFVAKVSQLTQLPSGEQPTIAKVSDITKLQGQPFFKNAQNGDVVLIYPKAKEAILYSPTTNKIITIGPINVDQSVQGASTVAVPTAAMPLTVALYNGTTISGLTKKIQVELAQEMPSVTVVANTNANNQNYKQTIVIDLTGKELTAAKQLASILHGTVGTLPAGEVAPADANTDIVVILGQQ